MKNRRRVVKTIITISLSCFALLLISACLERKLVHPYTMTVSVEKFRADKDILSGSLNRIKVSGIYVVAPRKGDKLFSSGLKRTTTRMGSSPITETFHASYYLENDLENYVRSALDYAFVIEESSHNFVNIIATVDINSRLRKIRGMCRHWANSTSIGIDVEFLSEGAPTIARRYSSLVDETYCQHAFSFWPEETAIAASIEKSINLTTRKLIQGLSHQVFEKPES